MTTDPNVMLYERIKNLEKEQRYPFHMPGHKRNPGAGPLASAMAVDITEIDGFDDLHHATGIIKEAQDRAAILYGSEECRFLVNGSTCGVLAAVSAVLCGRRDPIILAGRGSHLSLYHAAYLNDASIDTLWEKDVLYGGILVPGTVCPEDVREHLEKAGSVGSLPDALFFTDPNYYGVLAKTQEITDIAHSYGIPVIVDAAHGAHLGLGKGIPDSAVHAGADIVVMSTHKTLPCLTQTALLHMQGDLVSRDKVDRFLRIYQTSSPSYVLMSSIEEGLAMMSGKGISAERLLSYRKTVMECAGRLKQLTLLPGEVIGDPCKIVLSAVNSSITGRELYRMLLYDHNLQPEMADNDNVVLIITEMDTEEGIKRLTEAIGAIDSKLVSDRPDDHTGTTEGKRIHSEYAHLSAYAPHPQNAMKIREAWDAPSESLPLDAAEGRVCADIVAPYPPGTPVLVPGEMIGRDSIAYIRRLITSGCELRGVTKETLLSVTSS